MSLKRDMKRLVAFATGLAKQAGFGEAPDPHLAICQATADHFSLWDDTYQPGIQEFPIWLSRVVEGVLRDEGVQS